MSNRTGGHAPSPHPAPASAARDLRTEQKNLADIHTRLARLLMCDAIHSDEMAELFLGQGGGAAPNLAEILRRVEQDTIPQEFAEIAGITGMAGTVGAADATGNTAGTYAGAGEKEDPRLSYMLAGLRLTEQLGLSGAIASRFPAEPTALTEALFGRAEAISPTAGQKISYQRNIYTDEAFLHFARALPGEGRAQYAESFSDVCELVSSGQCEFCILPLESAQEGKLFRFYSMIERYELKITMACEVTASDNRHTTTFGLCRRDILPEDLNFSSRQRRFSMILREDMVHLHVHEVLSAADMCGLHLLRADCLPRSDDEIVMGAGYPFNLTFSFDGEHAGRGAPFDLRTFLVYLSLFVPSYLPLGIYRSL